MKYILYAVQTIILLVTVICWQGKPQAATHADIVIVGATPAGLGAGIAAARLGKDVVIIELPGYFGGLMTNGLGRTDFKVKSCAGGIFKEFTDRVFRYYFDMYGEESAQVMDCYGGYYFEPHAAMKVWKDLVGEEKNLTILYNNRFDGVVMNGDTIVGVNGINLETAEIDTYYGKIVIDATYEGDVAAASGVPYRIGRESRNEFNEPHAGKTYIPWGTVDPRPGSTGEGDDRIQAYNFRLCMTMEPDNMVVISKPEFYDEEAYLSAVDDIKSGRAATILDFIFPFPVPNEKFDVNNQHRARISTDFPEENFDYPEADYEEREKIVARHRDYILGFIWFLQQDKRVPYEFRKEAMSWGLARDEFIDTEYFPRQIYVREARRIEGEYTFTEHDALQARGQRRTKIFYDAIAVGDYNLDSHATRKRESNHPEALEGFWGLPITMPYQIPYRIMVPRKIENLLVPVAVSATHVGISTIRMEPVWLSLGQAAGTSASIAIDRNLTVRAAPVASVQHALISQGQVITVFFDVPPDDHGWQASQYLGTKGFFKDYLADLNAPISPEEYLGMIKSIRRLSAGEDWQRMINRELQFNSLATRRDLFRKLYEVLKNYEDIGILKIDGI